MISQPPDPRYGRIPDDVMLTLRWIAVALVLMLATGATRAGAPPPAPEYVEGEVLVTFKESVGLDSARQALAQHAVELRKHFHWLSEQRHRVFTHLRSRTRTTAALIAELKQDPNVETVEPNYLRRRCDMPAPNDPLFPQLWALQNTGQAVSGTAGTAGADIRFLSAWGLAQSSTGQVVVAVVDTGVDYTHPDLASNLWTNTGEIPNNGIDDDGNGYKDDTHGYDFVTPSSDPMDSGDHGTHVAGTIAAAGNNNLGVIGVDFQAQIMALKVSTDGTYFVTSAIVEAIQYAAMMKQRGVNVVAINGSYGSSSPSTTERAAIQAAGDAGIIFCAAAATRR